MEESKEKTDVTRDFYSSEDLKLIKKQKIMDSKSD